jgi:hypothetical protein
LLILVVGVGMGSGWSEAGWWMMTREVGDGWELMEEDE